MAKHKTALVVMALVGVPFFLASCKGTEPGAAADELHVLKVEGAAVCYNQTLAPFSWMWSGEERPAGVLARDGDVLVFIEDVKEGAPISVRYQATDGTALTVAFEGGRLLLGGKTVSVLLKDQIAWEWLGEASEEDLKGLRLLQAPESLQAAHLEILKKVAKTNPAIDLFFVPSENKEDVAAEVLRIFRPRLLNIAAATLAAEIEQVQPNLKDVEVLTLENVEGESLDFLARLPRLRCLWLVNWSPEQSPLPKNLKHLKALTLSGGTSPSDLSPLADLAHLEQLTLFGGTAEDLAPLAKLQNLKILSLAGCEKVTDLSPVKDLALKYLALPPKTSQAEFDAVVKDHPALKAVELVKCENVKDLAALKSLQNLEVLVLAKPDVEVEDLLADLKEMKGLRLLVLPPDAFDDDAEEIAELQQALPDCLITAGKPMCLGSGWILLLVPVAAGAWLIARRRRG